VFGPQYMIPSRFLPPKYNYYRPLPQSLRHSESGGSGGDVEMTGEDILSNANVFSHLSYILLDLAVAGSADGCVT
jgi:hypothetical protein